MTTTGYLILLSILLAFLVYLYYVLTAYILERKRARSTPMQKRIERELASWRSQHNEHLEALKGICDKRKSAKSYLQQRNEALSRKQPAPQPPMSVVKQDTDESNPFYYTRPRTSKDPNEPTTGTNIQLNTRIRNRNPKCGPE